MGTLPSSPLFVFGSLLDDDILSIVLGPGASERLHREPASLCGFHRRRVHGEPFPMLVEHPAPEAEVAGALLHGLDGEAWARLRFYEGPGYALRRLHVASGERRRQRPADVFLATERLRDSGTPWDLDHWRRTEKPLAVLLARDLMALYGQTDPDGPPDAVWEDIKIRCRARLSAVPERDHAHCSRTAASRGVD